MATETRPFGTTLTFGYDAAGRVTSRTGTDGSLQSFTYGPGDRMATITDGTGTTTYGYDAAGQFSGLDQPSGGEWQQDHDALDRVSAVRARAPLSPATAFESTYTYDAAGNLHTVTDPFGRTTTYTYDAANRLTEILRPNGVRTTTTYDARDRVASIVHADGAGTVLASVAYVRSASGEPTRITREDGSYVLIDYDAALRVERERYFDASDVLEEEIAYTYDRDGNRTSRTTSAGAETYVYGPGSQLLRIERGGVAVSEYTYDGGGRVTRLERDGRDWTLDYDADDHVVEIEDASTGEGARYGFDAEGRRVSRQALMAGLVVAGLSMVTAPTLAADLDSPHLTADDSGAARAGYVFDGEHAMARYDASSGEPTYYLRDAMGSVIGLVDAAGASSARVHYDGFGNERRVDGALAALPDEGGPRFQGMWRESTGLYYVRARTYDSRSGRFFSRDRRAGEVANPSSFAPYAAANDNFYLFRDPSGLFSLSEVSWASVAVGAIVGGGVPLAANFRAWRCGQISTSDYFGEALAGAVLGAVAAYFGGAVLAANGGFWALFTSQLVLNLSGTVLQNVIFGRDYLSIQQAILTTIFTAVGAGLVHFTAGSGWRTTGRASDPDGFLANSAEDWVVAGTQGTILGFAQSLTSAVVSIIESDCP